MIFRGHFFGEMAIVKNINRSGSAIAVGRSILVRRFSVLLLLMSG